MLSHAALKEMAAKYAQDNALRVVRPERAFSLTMDIYVQPKERARGSSFYTPVKTRRFEKAVADAAVAWREKTGTPIITSSVAMHLQLRDKVPKAFTDLERELALKGYLYSGHGDVDNRVKAISDALNGIAFRDDKQVAQMFVSRRYAEKAGFTIDLSPMGLTRSEATLLTKFIEAMK